MQYTVKLPKILCLSLIISKFAKETKYYNTNDLIKIANSVKPELVRTRKDKNDYKYFDDTNFGGLRGNFSTVLTLKGFVKKGNGYSPYYGIGKSDRLINAYKNGEFILDTQKYIAYTNNSELKKLLESEAKNLSIREAQAHIKIFLNKNKDFPLVRDNINFKKMCVLKSKKDQYFLRILFNTFVKDDVVQFNMYNYLSGPKVKQFNMHALFVIPSKENNWEEFYVIDSKYILSNSPLFMYFDKKLKKFYDVYGNVYEAYCLSDGLDILSDQNGNIAERLNYDWNSIKQNLVDDVVETNVSEEDEFSVFLNDYLNWKREFTIYGKRVVNLFVSSSGGADVIIEFSGGTTQKLELEHKWNNYIIHQHYKSYAWKNSWLYADEEWDFEKIKRIFSPYISSYLDNIPKVFLCTDKITKQKKAYEVDWDSFTYKEIEVGK